MNPFTSRITARWQASARGAALRLEAGQTLFEIGVMVSALIVLAGTLLPVMGDSIANARVVVARNDATQIATAIVNFQRDLGPLVLRRAAPSSSSDRTVAIDVLISNGPLPGLAAAVPAASPAGAGLPARPGRIGRQALEPWTTLFSADVLAAHLRFNGRAYPAAASGTVTGWNGPYLGRDITSDPWGHAYLVNTALLRDNDGMMGVRFANAVFVLSAGPNGVIETPFVQPIQTAHAFGDDLIVRIQ
ncbi:MAG: hypothetical protein WCP29_17375 [Acidobacteriota bacterium]